MVRSILNADMVLVLVLVLVVVVVVVVVGGEGRFTEGTRIQGHARWILPAIEQISDE